jgi:CHASE3 domain sensor protein
LIVLACLRLQRFLDTASRDRNNPAQRRRLFGFKVAALLGAMGLAFFLYRHASLWQIARIDQLHTMVYRNSPIHPIQLPDPGYISTVKISFALTLISLLAWVAVFIWQLRKNRTAVRANSLADN